MRLPVAAACIAVLAAAGAAVGSPGATTSAAGVTCAYVQAGPPGPGGNRLQITDVRTGVIIFRNGTEIGVQAFDSNRTLITCSGPTPRVTNVDRIDVKSSGRFSGLLVDETGRFIFHPHTSGLFAPGATPEPGGDEIEIRPSGGPPSVLIEGRPEGDKIELGNLAGGRTGINLNVAEDGSQPDADVVVGYPRSKLEVRVVGNDGGDRLRAQGRGGFTGKLTIARLALQGNNGNDLLLGSVGRDVLSAGRGNDEARGGKGRDILRLDGGHDAGYAGPGRDSIYIVSDVGSVPPDDNRDLIFAGSGDDEVESAGNGFADRVACGRGRDRALVDSADRRRNCERVTVR
jgi:hypothetical protein